MRHLSTGGASAPLYLGHVSRIAPEDKGMFAPSAAGVARDASRLLIRKEEIDRRIQSVTQPLERSGQSRLSGCSAKGAPRWLSRPGLFSTQLFVCGLLSLARISSDLPTGFKECFSMTLKLTSQGTWTILSKMRGLKNASEISSPARLAAQSASHRNSLPSS
jgi:hypothetical protein